MKFLRHIIIFILIGITSFCQGQVQRLNDFELSIDVGFSKDTGPVGIYPTTSVFEDLIVAKKSMSRVRNWSFSYTRYLNPKNGVKLLFGQSQFGFDFEGELRNSLTPARGFIRTTHLEWGASYIRKISLPRNYNLLLEPGLRYHTDGSSRSNLISLANLDVFSLSTYAGIEFPMLGNSFFTNVGLQVKIPLQQYNFDFGTTPSFYPYFIGIKVGVNYQFSWSKKSGVETF